MFARGNQHFSGIHFHTNDALVGEVQSFLKSITMILKNYLWDRKAVLKVHVCT